jgi:hypothetical protein
MRPAAQLAAACQSVLRRVEFHSGTDFASRGAAAPCLPGGAAVCSARWWPTRLPWRRPEASATDRSTPTRTATLPPGRMRASPAARDRRPHRTTSRRATWPDPWHPVHRYNVGACELPIGGARCRNEAEATARTTARWLLHLAQCDSRRPDNGGRHERSCGTHPSWRRASQPFTGVPVPASATRRCLPAKGALGVSGPVAPRSSSQRTLKRRPRCLHRRQTRTRRTLSPRAFAALRSARSLCGRKHQERAVAGPSQPSVASIRRQP